ncbi:MAG: hypothetical protein MZU79_00570 [Anaerotruncus sp.]|nr:hypothetical protein [Anaerotruncus sp.]
MRAAGGVRLATSWQRALERLPGGAARSSSATPTQLENVNGAVPAHQLHRRGGDASRRRAARSRGATTSAPRTRQRSPRTTTARCSCATTRSEAKAFYMKENPADPRDRAVRRPASRPRATARSSAARQREDDHDRLLARIREQGLPDGGVRAGTSTCGRYSSFGAPRRLRHRHRSASGRLARAASRTSAKPIPFPRQLLAISVAGRPTSCLGGVPRRVRRAAAEAPLGLRVAERRGVMRGQGRRDEGLVVLSAAKNGSASGTNLMRDPSLRSG